MAAPEYGRVIDSITVDGVTYTYGGKTVATIITETTGDDEETITTASNQVMGLFYKIPGIPNEVVLCSDITAEEPVLYKRTCVNGVYTVTEMEEESEDDGGEG